MIRRLTRLILAALCLATTLAAGQNTATTLAELISLKEQIANPDTRTRVAATHRVWQLGVASPDPEVKMNALQLLGEPIRSSSDHIRMPAVYAMAEIAAGSDDPKVKVKALEMLFEPLNAGQVPIRDAAIDAVNQITRSGNSGGVAAAAVKALRPPIASGNNGVRIPAINALVIAVKGSQDEAAHQAAIDALMPALDSMAMIGGMEVRMMALVALERIGLDATDTGTKAKAMGLLQSYAGRGGWEPEAKQRASEAAAAIQATLKK